MLFFMSVINYIDRQTLGVLAPILMKEYNWNNKDFATILIAFRIAYTVMQGGNGRLLDRFGTRLWLSISVGFYSAVQMLMMTVNGLVGFRTFRFLLACGEGANNPGATKAVSEWFPPKERAWAVAWFDAGCSIGGGVAPFIVLFLYRAFDDWRPAFFFTGSLGVVWLIAWRFIYHPPEKHPRISPEELEHIRRERGIAGAGESEPPGIQWSKLFRYGQTLGIMAGRFLIDPYWFFIEGWFAVYLKSKGFSLEQSMIGAWAPFLASDIGNFAGGGLSYFLIRRGWPIGRSRRTTLLTFGPSMLILIPAAFLDDYWSLLALFSYATFAYSACSTIFLSLPADVFHSRAVGSVAGLGGTSAGGGVIITTYLIGWVTDNFSFKPVIITASILPCIATLLFVSLVRRGDKPDPERVLLDF